LSGRVAVLVGEMGWAVCDSSGDLLSFVSFIVFR
jgi:hypothetical protein